MGVWLWPVLACPPTSSLWPGGDQGEQAAHSGLSLHRFLTYSYLLAFNMWLLLAPVTLCYDWQVGSIPLVESLWDARNLASLLLALGLGALSLHCLEAYKVFLKWTREEGEGCMEGECGSGWKVIGGWTEASGGRWEANGGGEWEGMRGEWEVIGGWMRGEGEATAFSLL